MVEAVRETLTDHALDPAFIAEAVLLPTEAFIGDQMKLVDPEAIHRAREALRARARPRRSSRCGAPPMPRTAANRFELSPGGQGRAAAAHGRARLSDGRGGAADAPALA